MSHNSTKNSLLNTHTHLTDPHIETSKDGKVGGKKGKKPVAEAALQPGAYGRAQPREKKLGYGWLFLAWRSKEI